MATKTKTPICEFHAKMQCKFTDGSCRNDHALVDAARGAGICTFNLVGACSHSPCKYRHEPVSAVSKLLAKSGGGGSLVVKGGEKAATGHFTAVTTVTITKTKVVAVKGGGSGAGIAGLIGGGGGGKLLRDRRH